MLDAGRTGVNTLDKRGLTPIMAACLSGDSNVYTALIAHSSEGEINIRNEVGQSALMLAAAQGATEIVRDLVSRDDVQFNMKDNSGKTAVHHAAAERKGMTLWEMLQSDDVVGRVRDRDGKTPLDLLAEGEPVLDDPTPLNEANALALAEIDLLREENEKLRTAMGKVNERLTSIEQLIRRLKGIEMDE